MPGLDAVKRVLSAFSEAERLELMAYLAESTGEVERSGPKKRIVAEYRRCYGRACATCDAGRAHGPYLYEVWKEGGRVRRRYVRKGLPEDAGG